MLDAMHPLGRCGQPVEVAYIVAFLCSEQAAWVAGINFVMDGW